MKMNKRIASYIIGDTVVNEFEIDMETVLLLSSLEGETLGVTDAAFSRYPYNQEVVLLVAIDKLLGII